MSRLGEFAEAAYESVWMCRLSESRLVTPVDPPAIERYGLPPNRPTWPWTYDYYAHLVAAQRLLASGEAINQSQKNTHLAQAIDQFRAHWSRLKPLRDALFHPQSKAIPWQHVHAFFDRIEYRHPVSKEIVWVFTIEELHRPVEELYAAITLNGDSSGKYAVRP